MLAAEAIAAFQALPLAGLDDVLGGATPLVLAPHPDDESLGCGGLIAACCAEGRVPLVAILTDGVGSHPGSLRYPPPRLRALREREAAEATAALGLPAERLRFLRLADTAAPRSGPAFDQAVNTVGELARDAGCGVILAPWRHDPHGDHAAAHLIATAAAAQIGVTLLSYPVWGWTLPADRALDEPPIRGWRLDIAAWLPAKRRAIAAHRSQISDLIDDDPNGFRLPADMLRLFDRPYEVFLRHP